jgi:hypothetical protein
MNLGILDTTILKGRTTQMGPEFFQTGMGRTYYEHTMPMLVKQLAELNQNLITLTKLIEQNAATDRQHIESKRVKVLDDDIASF